MQFPIDKVMNQILNDAEDKFKDRGITREQIKEAFYFYFRISGDLMKSFDFPTIVFPKWGKFRPIVSRVAKLKGKQKEPELVEKLGLAVDRLTKEKQSLKRKKNDRKK